jgi:4-hydroxybenzoate polyprenyltransferase
MHQLPEKIILITKICGNNILTNFYRFSAIVIIFARKLSLKLKPVLKKTILFAKAYVRIIFKILRQINVVLVAFAKQSLVILKLLIKKTGLFTKVSASMTLKTLRRIYDALVVFIKKIFMVLKLVGRNINSFVRSHWLSTKDRLVQYYYLTRLDKPIGILLLLWPVLWALWIASEGSPDLDVLIIFILGVIVMRSTGCVINDLADRDLDRHVSRTRDRPITSGNVEVLEAVELVVLLLLCAVVLVLNLNIFTFKLSFVGVFLAVIYPFMKRFTYLPQVFLGLAFAWAVPMAFAAQTNSVPEIAWLLFITTVLWAVVYDTMYAMVDKEDDLKIGVKSTAILFDDADRAIIGFVQLMILCSQILAGVKLGLGQYYYAGIAIASLLSVYQQYLIKDRIPDKCFRAFLNNQWYGMVIFAGLYLNYMFG